MRKLMLLAVAMLTVSMAMAIPARPGVTVVRQPDGTTLNIRLVGDEYLHFNTTADGYTIVQRTDGFYVYAQLDADSQLAATERVAHNAEARTAAEQAWLQQQPLRLTPAPTPDMARERQQEHARRAQALRKPIYDYNNFRGLIILVQYNDCEFSRSDINTIIDGMANIPDYTGYDNTRYGRFTGSVRDYFYDNSGGRFAPQFDVVGPVTISYSQYYANGTKNAGVLMNAALAAADAEVDYSIYDRDNDGVVDMVYFLYSGLGSNIEGNDQRLLWPHASSIYNTNGGYGNWQLVKDGVSFGRYACSTELTGSAQYSVLDGIGVICHEFGHVLGLPDLYDTDYSGSGGDAAHPAEWCIMAAGGYLNNSRTPAGYSLYERYTLGFATPEPVMAEGDYTLPPIGTSNQGYKLSSPVRNEYFLIENRQNTSKWDRYLPGHGMLVFRVDSTSTSAWSSNAANANPKHMYFELLRAGGPYFNSEGDAQAVASDPFPGTRGVTALDNETSPANLLTWAGRPNALGFEHISEKSNGNISFSLYNVNILKSITMPEALTVGKGLSVPIPVTLKPATAIYEGQWSSSDERVATVSSDGRVTGVGEGEANITLVATSNDQTFVASCHVTVEQQDIKNGIAEFRSMADGSAAVVMLTDALVVFVDGNDVYVRDASGAIVFSGTGLSLQVGDKINGHVYGRLAVKDGMPQLLPVMGSTDDTGYTLTGGNAVEPRDVALGSITDADRGDLLRVTQVLMTVDSKTGAWLKDEQHSIRVFNGFGLKNVKTVKDYTKYYNITGILHTAVLNGEVIDQLSFATKSPFEETEAPSAIILPEQAAVDAASPVMVYTTAGRLVARCSAGALQQLPLRSGVYVVRAGSQSWKLVLGTEKR